jgi:hypothetical protein
MEMQTRRTAALGVTTVIAVGLFAAHGPAAEAAPKRADLSVTTIGAAPAVALPGASFGVTATVANRGRAAASPTKLTVYLSKDKRLGAGDLAGGTVTVTKVAPGRKQAVTVKAKVPAKATGGYWVLACADATKKVREASEKNNCRTSRSRVSIGGSGPTPGGSGGTLTGTLTFTDTGRVEDAPRIRTWQRSASATVNIAVSGAWAGRPTFASTGSPYTQTGEDKTGTASPGCLDEEKRSQSANATFGYTGDAFTDDITGSFTKIDGSGVSLGLHMTYQQQKTLTKVPQGAAPTCDLTSTTTNLSDALEVAVVKLEQVSRTATSITYRPVSWVADMSTTSEWDEVEGQLTLTFG